MLKKKFLIFPIILILTFSCGNNDGLIKKPEKVPPLDILYKTAFKLYEEGSWSEAIDLFQKVETKYSFSEWAPRATLMIMYIYYESSEYYQALEYANKYKKLYPSSKNITYVDYLIGLVFYEQISTVARDQTYTKEALKKFNELIDNNPNSIYAKEAKYKIDLINEQLAGKEMYLARYYMKKSKWVAAIKRLNIILDKYEQTVYVPEALHRLVEIYYKLGNLNQASKYGAILGYNFNDNEWYKKSYKIVADKDYSTEKKAQKIKFRDKIKTIFNFTE
jgi:outer membrane protein assembly factor BamD